MADKKISELLDAELPLSGDEIIPVVQAGSNRKLLTSTIQVYIPEPKVSILRNEFSVNTMVASWHSQNLNFLQYAPQYYLFRYKGKGKGKKTDFSESYFIPRGFCHPVHLNGVNSLNDKWWAGGSADQFGAQLPPRITEWDIPSDQQAGTKTNLDLQKSDWVFVQNVPPCHIDDFRVRGAATRNAKNAYFKIAIGITVGNNISDCPVVFGPLSPTFALVPRYFMSNQWENWDWKFVG